MIEANEDISLITERQLQDVQEGQALAKAIAEGHMEHPARLVRQPQPDLDTTSHQIAKTQTLQPQPVVDRPADPDAAFRHIRLAAVAVIVLILFLAWFRQRKG